MNKYQPRTLKNYPGKVRRNTFSDKQKLREFVASRPVLKGLLKQVLGVTGWLSNLSIYLCFRSWYQHPGIKLLGVPALKESASCFPSASPSACALYLSLSQINKPKKKKLFSKNENDIGETWIYIKKRKYKWW